MIDEITPLQTLLLAFPGIREAEAQELINSGEMHTYPENIILCHEDALETIFYIILDGKVEVTKAIAEDQARHLNTLHAGDFFGEMAIIHDAPRAATVATSDPTTVLEIHKDAFQELLHKSASVSNAMVQEVSRRLRENDAMAIEDLRIKAAELASAYQQLAEQEFARREFLTMIAHELRTPLTAASGFLQILDMAMRQGQTLDSQMLQTALQSATRNIQQIVSLVNDILFVQEMDLILPRFETTDIRLVLSNAVERCQKRMQENQVTLNMGIPANPLLISGDSKSLERAFGAILDNAIKFSYGEGAVEVRAGQEEAQIWVKVEDHGVGISREVMPHIFDRFFHVDQIDGRMFRGAGLGLSIARQILEEHDGRIRVESEPGKGTIVLVYLNRSDKV